MNKELSILNIAKESLTQLGNIQLSYITAELEPFSNQQKPDLVIYPANTPNKALFIEYKTAPIGGFKDGFWIAFEEKKKFVKESSEIEIAYIFSTDIKLSDSVKLELEKHDIVVIDEVVDAAILSIKINQYINESQ